MAVAAKAECGPKTRLPAHPATLSSVNEDPPGQCYSARSGGEFMPAYRLYRVDGAGSILSAEWLEAADDQAALSQARARADGTWCEVWQRDRLVARLEPKTRA